MSRRKLTAEEIEAKRDAAYERGWVDSLRAHDRASCQPNADIYCYREGWEACAKYRWQDPSNRGRATDPGFRIPKATAMTTRIPPWAKYLPGIESIKPGAAILTG